jgi:NodT family efflux transporter outer membrane factor (OMF) lipoprotein
MAAALLILTALGVAGCNVGPNYHPPQTSVPAGFAAAPSQPSSRPAEAGTAGAAGSAMTQPVLVSVTTQPVRITQWWATLNDPILDRLIDRAVQSNLNLKSATARLREARARQAIASGAQLPQLDARTAFSHQRISGNSQPFASVQPGFFPFEWNLYQLGFDANWELDVFGGSRRALEAAGADLGASIEDRRDVLLSVMAEVARNYVELRGTQRELEVAQANLKVQRQTLDLTQNQRRQGVVTQLDVARAQAQTADTESQLPALQSRQWRIIHRIALLLGEEPNALAGELATHAPIPLPPGTVPVGLPSDLLRRRPDIRRAERRLAGASARIGVAVADLFPRFSLVAGAGVDSSDSENLFNWGSRTFNVGPSVRWPIFNAGKLRAMVQVRNAQQEQALIAYQKTVLSALAEVEDAIVALTTEQQRAQSLDERVSATSEAAQIAADQYRQGLSDFLTVLDAQRSLLEAEDEQARSRQSVTTDLIALYKALGGGWELNGSPSQGASPQGRVAHASDVSVEKTNR